MSQIKDLLTRNQRWAERIQTENPHFFKNLSEQQAPRYLWIGCSDSRVPATQIVDLEPGEIFVHRNIANVIVHTDLNALSVIQYAVEVLKVEYVLVVGHYGCGGVGAALQDDRLGLIDNWLLHVEDVARQHAGELDPDLPFKQRHARLCELNAIEQAMNVCATGILNDAWARGQALRVHAWIYGLDDGRMHDLGLDVSGPENMYAAYREALESRRANWSRGESA